MVAMTLLLLQAAAAGDDGQLQEACKARNTNICNAPIVLNSQCTIVYNLLLNKGVN